MPSTATVHIGQKLPPTSSNLLILPVHTFLSFFFFFSISDFFLKHNGAPSSPFVPCNVCSCNEPLLFHCSNHCWWITAPVHFGYYDHVFKADIPPSPCSLLVEPTVPASTTPTPHHVISVDGESRPRQAFFAFSTCLAWLIRGTEQRLPRAPCPWSTINRSGKARSSTKQRPPNLAKTLRGADQTRVARQQTTS